MLPPHPLMQETRRCCGSANGKSMIRTALCLTHGIRHAVKLGRSLTGGTLAHITSASAKDVAGRCSRSLMETTMDLHEFVWSSVGALFLIGSLTALYRLWRSEDRGAKKRAALRERLAKEG